MRMERYIEVDTFINEVNRPGSEETHTAAHNQFSTWTAQEFEKLMTIKGHKTKKSEQLQVEENLKEELKLKEVTDEVDWRT